MPIINDNPVVPPIAHKPDKVEITKPTYRGNVVDSRYTPLSALLTSIEGSHWTTDYYSQVVGDDNALVGQNVNRDAVYQQYKLIKRFELKVTQPLSTSQDQTQKTMLTTGGANVYPFLIPSEGDMFLADIGDGREGIFRIMSSERKSIYKETCYFVEYELVNYSTDELRHDLNSKVVETIYFVKDFLQYGQDPMLTHSEWEVFHDLAYWADERIRLWCRMFLSNEFKVFVLPGQPEPTFDRFLAKAIKMVFDSKDSELMLYARILNTDDDDVMRAFSVWDAMLERDRNIMQYVFRKTGLTLARNFDRDAMHEGVHYSGLHYLVYPKDAYVAVDYQMWPRNKPIADEQVVNTTLPMSMINTQLAGFDAALTPVPPISGGVTDNPPIHPINMDEGYIFSPAFYDQAVTGQSQLEVQVNLYIDRKALDNRILLSLCEGFQKWGQLERFYYLPVLLILVKSAIRSI